MPEKVIANATHQLEIAVADLHTLVSKTTSKNRRLTWITRLLAVAFVALLVIAWQQRQNTQRDLASREEARYSACVGFNIAQEGDRDAHMNTLLVTFRIVPAAGEITAEDRERIVAALDADLQERYRAVETQIAIENPYRDCSPAGIDAYFENPPPDPATTTTEPS